MLHSFETPCSPSPSICLKDVPVCSVYGTYYDYFIINYYMIIVMSSSMGEFIYCMHYLYIIYIINMYS